MKSVIIIDNFNKENKKFQKRFNQVLDHLKNEIRWEFVQYTELKDLDKVNTLQQADGIILTGSYEMLSKESVQQHYNHEKTLIRQLNQPILGVCFGNQMIACAYGFKIHNLNHPDPNIEYEKTILLSIDKPIALVNFKRIWVYETHHQEIRVTSEFLKSFNIHASSEVCKAQIISHKKKPMFGVQFHPENPTDPKAWKDGKKLFTNFINLL